MRQTIPKRVIAVASQVLGEHYYSHNKLNTLFMEAGAPGDPPEGSCVQKCSSWLKRTNEDPSVTPLNILGEVLLQFLETGGGASHYDHKKIKEGQERVRRALARSGLAYHEGGIVISGGQSPQVADLNEALRCRDLPALDREFRRALAFIESDPPAAVTAACSILEALFKVILDKEAVPLPAKKTIKPLWAAVQKTIGLAQTGVVEEDIGRIISGLTSVIDGIGALRTHAGSAHGRRPQDYMVTSREARLAVHAAHTLCFFVLETWESADRLR